MSTLCSALRPTAALLTMLLSLAAPSHAATLSVPAQYPNIQAAVTASQSGDTVLVADGTYSGPGNRDIDFGGRSITVVSRGGAARTIIDCGGYNSSDGSSNHRGFYIHSGEVGAVICGFTVKNGYEKYFPMNADSTDGGGICVYGSGVSIQNCTVSGDTAQIYGGGIYVLNTGTGAVTLTGCTVSANTSRQAGGGVYNLNSSTGTIVLTDCTVSGNASSDFGGGGIYNLNNSAGTITLTGCNVSANTATSSGGGIYNDNSEGNGAGAITLMGCTVSSNTGYEGGGVYDHNGSTSTIALTGCTISANIAQTKGGGVDNFNDHNESGTIILKGCAVSGNTALTYGGGIFNFNYGADGTTVLTNCAVSANIAQQGGGVCNSNFSGNGTSAITVANCTVSGNAASQDGGGVYLYNNGGSLTFADDIVYGDTGGETFISSGTPVVSFCDIRGGYPGAGNIDADPLFVNAALGNFHLKPGSPCLGAGTHTGAPPPTKTALPGPTRLPSALMKRPSATATSYGPTRTAA